MQHKPIRLSIPSVESGFVSVLLVKTLRSSTFRLALLSIAIFGAAVVALLGYLYWSTASFVRSQSDRSIGIELATLQKTYAASGRNGLIGAIAQRLADQGSDSNVYLLTDPSFMPLAGNLADWPSVLKGAGGSGDFDTNDGRHLLRASFMTLSDGNHLLAGKSIDDLNELTQKTHVALALCLLLIFTLAGVASVFVTRRTVGRIEAINATSRTIMQSGQSGLGQRIPLRGTHDEWDGLAANLNSMLERIETLMGEVKKATDNVAHDLRTPLARMRGRLEKAYAMERNGCDKALISDTLADLEGVLRMFSSLTRISHVEAYDQTTAFRPVNLAEVASEVVELFDAAAEEKGVDIVAIGDRRVAIRGDRDLLFDAVANLVDNAIKHGCDDGRVTVEVKEIDGSAIISVTDDGPGNQVEEYNHIFKRFYRLERSRHTPGNGLGLSLVAEVTRLHGARIDMADNSPGLKFQLWFPSIKSDLQAVSQ